MIYAAVCFAVVYITSCAGLVLNAYQWCVTRRIQFGVALVHIWLCDWFLLAADHGRLFGRLLSHTDHFNPPEFAARLSGNTPGFRINYYYQIQDRFSWRITFCEILWCIRSSSTTCHVVSQAGFRLDDKTGKNWGLSERENIICNLKNLTLKSTKKWPKTYLFPDYRQFLTNTTFNFLLLTLNLSSEPWSQVQYMTPHDVGAALKFLLQRPVGLPLARTIQLWLSVLNLVVVRVSTHILLCW